MAGDALETANRSRRSAASEEEDDGDGGSTGRPASCGLTESFRARGRSSCACRGGEGRPVAAAMANGGDGCVRTRERESEGKGEKHGREGGEARGSGRHREEAPRRRAGGGGRQTSWWRGAPAVRARRPHAWPTGARRTTAVVGWAGLLGRPAGWAAQVSFSLFFLFLFLFNISATLLN